MKTTVVGVVNFKFEYLESLKSAPNITVNVYHAPFMRCKQIEKSFDGGYSGSRKSKQQYVGRLWWGLMATAFGG